MLTCSRTRKSIQILLLCIFAGVLVPLIQAQPSSIEQARRIKIDSFIKIAEVQINRGLYDKAKLQLIELQENPGYSLYLSEEQKQTIGALLSKIDRATDERKKITQALLDSDVLAAQEKYEEAAKLLAAVKDSEFATDQEKAMLSSLYNEMIAKVNEGHQKWQDLYDASVNAYEAGDYEKARAGFVQVSESGAKVKGDKLPEDYILMIDTGVGVEPEIQEPEIQDVQELVPLVQAPVEIAEPQAGEELDPSEMLAPVEPVVVEVETIAEAQPAVSQQEQSYLDVVQSKRNRLISYTQAVVDDALGKADRYLNANEFELAKQSLRRGFSTVESNKMLLGDEQYKSYQAQLSNLEQRVLDAQQEYERQQAAKRQEDADKLTENIRKTMEEQREQAVQSYMQRAYAFIEEERFEEALGQLEQLLAIDHQNQQALMLQRSLQYNVQHIEQRRILEEAEQQEIEVLMLADKASIPYAQEINYPRTWKELSKRRDELASKEGMDPLDAAVNKLLDHTVDLTSLTEDTTFEEAIQILQNSVTPPLTIIVLWGDLSETAFIEKDTAINMSGEALGNIVLRTGLNRLLQSVSSGAFAELGYVIEDGIVTIATQDSLPASYRTEIYDVTDLVNPPATYFGGGGMGMGGGGGMGMSGGGMSGGGMGMSGGGMGGSYNYLQRNRAYELIYTIMQTIEPESWYENDEGIGDGRIDQYSEAKLLIWQTPEVHEQIREFLDKLRQGLGEQISIEARFLLVSENFLEDVGIDMDLQFGHVTGTDAQGNPIYGGPQFLQDSWSHTQPTSTGIASSLGNIIADYEGTGSGVGPSGVVPKWTYSLMDDLQVDFIVRATQAHANGRQLSAPKAMVLNGESATLQVTTTKRIKTDSTLESETVTSDATSYTVAYWTHENEDVDTGITLSIIPAISADKKYVILHVTTYVQDLLETATETATGIVTNPTSNVSAVQTDTYQLPTTQYTSIMTRVAVPDQGTVMLGGLTLTAQKEVESGTPILSKLPLIGRLFSNRSEVKDKSMLLILVKPSILLQAEQEADAMAALSGN